MTPNTQITKDNVGLLKAGDVCRVNAKPTSWHMSEVGDIVTVLKGPDSRGDYMITPNSQWYSPDRLTYIGPDLGDGWIGHSGGENPVPGMTVQWKARDGVSGKSYCAWGWEWSATDPDRDIITFRPAISPPAEGEECDGCDTSGRCTYVGSVCTTPTPSPVDWTVVGPKLVEALEGTVPVLRAMAETEGSNPGVATSRYRAALAALAAAQPQSNGE